MADSESSTVKAPAFQFYPNDFLSDRNVVVMSMQERGVYITLICYAWQSPLRADVAHLARICGVPVTAFRKLWPAVSLCFREQDGLLVHPRLERERQKQQEYRRRQSDRGRASGAARRTKHEPEANAGSIPVQPNANAGSVPVEPDTNKPVQLLSSSSVLSSSSDFGQGRTNRVPSRGLGGGALAGMLPRDHLRHVWCGRVCVPEFLHGRFLKAIGGQNPDESLRAFYAETFVGIPDAEPVESDPTKFWPARVSARWPSQSAAEGTRTQALRRASTEFLKS